MQIRNIDSRYIATVKKLLLSAWTAVLFIGAARSAEVPVLPSPVNAPLTLPLIVPKAQVPTATPPFPTRPSQPTRQSRLAANGAALPSGVGAGRTEGAFSVSESGSAAYSIPLWSPPGIGSLQLQLALNYNSRSPNGTLGVGWSLSGLSAISRCNKTWAQDGTPGQVTLQLSSSYSDRFCLDGRQLKLTGSSVSYGYPGSTYATEIESFSLIQASSASVGNGPASFTVTTKKGLIYSYGTTQDSQIPASGVQGTTIRTWALSQISDRVGNAIKFTYTNDLANGTYRLAEVQYPYTSTGQGPFYSVLFSYSQRPGAGTNSADTPSGFIAGYPWQELNKLDTITIQEAGGTVIKTYNLTYTQNTVSSRLQLTQVVECSASNCLPATSITYQNGAAGWTASTRVTGASTASLTKALPVDVNGDGVTDLVYPVSGGNGYNWYVILGSTSGTFGSPQSLGFSTKTTDPVIPADFLGRGIVDLLYPSGGDWWRLYWNSSTSSFLKLNTNIPVPTGTGSLTNAIAADVNGDGLPDLLYPYDDGAGDVSVYLQLNTTQAGAALTLGAANVAFTQSASGTHTWSLAWGGLNSAIGATPLVIADFNGDGRADVILHMQGTVETPNGFNTNYVWRVLLSSGNSFTAAAESIQTNGASQPVTLDWNGDGCTDVAVPEFQGPFNWQILISECAPNGLFYGPIDSGIPQSQTVIAADWDGDGRQDLLTEVNGGAWQVVRSTGPGASSTQVNTAVGAGSGAWFTGDFDGDGQIDLAYFDQSSGNTFKVNYHSDAAFPPDLGTSFTDGFAMKQRLTYAAISQSNYTINANARFPEQDYIGPLYVVNQFNASDGAGSTYQDQFWYYGARIHRQGRGFEGFSSRRTFDSRNSLYTYDGLSQTFPYTGLPTSGTVTSSSFATIKSWVSTPSSQTISGLGGFETRYFPYVSQTDLNEYEFGGSENGALITSTTSSYTYGDGYGNPTSIQTTMTDEDPASPFTGESWSETINTSFANSASTSAWCLGLPTNTTVESVVPGQTTQTRTYAFTPDTNTASCRIAQRTVEPTSPSQALTITETISFASSGCGNPTSVSIQGHNSDGSAMAARTASFGYGTRCQLAETVTNGLSQTTNLAYNYDFGKPTQLTDPNGIMTQWTYDDFGRTSQETRPDKTYSTFTYYSCNSPPCWGVADLRYSVYRDDYGSDGTLAFAEGGYWDGFKRPRYDQTTHFSGTLVYDAILGYDSLGRQTFSYRPTSSASNGYITYGYDALNRLIDANLYQGSGSLDRSVVLSYAGRTTVAEDPLHNFTTSVSDVQGHLRRVTDPSPGGTTNYSYDAFGNLNGISDAIGASSSATFNLLGFKTQVADADAGVWNFSGDSFNDLTAYSDADAHSFGFSYDVLGRLTSRTEPEGTSTWTWGSTGSQHNIGSLQSISGYGYAESLAYDTVGRLATDVITTDQAYQYDYTYDSAGRLSTITYPTSPAPTGTTATRYKVQYGYSYGALDSIADITQSTASPLWSLSSANDYSSATQESFGSNLLSVTSAYVPWTDALSSVQSGVSGSTSNRQNLAYQWDSDNNLKERQDNNQNVSESFNYDALNRLESSTLANSSGTNTNLSVTYDASGNILTRSDVGTYTYSSSRPHLLSKAGSSFTGSYDANGNTTSRNGLTQAWASFGLPTNLQAAVSGSTYSSQFSYGPDHQRYKQFATYSNGSETTLYAGGLLEKVNSSALGSVTAYRHYVPTPSGKLIVVYRKSDGSSVIDYVLDDHLGSSDAIVSGSGSQAGSLLVQESFASFGQRRASNWSAGTPSSGDYGAIAASTRRGFTAAEHLDNLGVVHMNGRVYDPTIGRFLSPDPLIPDLSDSQSTNPYAYVGNRPLVATDPTGLDPALDTVTVEAGGPTNPAGLVLTVADVAVDILGLSGVFGAAAPPPALAVHVASAQAGSGDNPCANGGASGTCSDVGDASGPEILVRGHPPTQAWVGRLLQIAGTDLGGTITRVVATPDDPESVATVYVSAHGFPQSLPNAWSFSGFLYYGLVRPVFGLFECVGGACTGTEQALRAISPVLMAIPGPEEEGVSLAARAGANAAEDAARVARGEPNRIYSARELVRRASERGPYHNFPESFNESIFRGNRQVISDKYVLYTQQGSINGIKGTFEIGVRPSVSGRTETIVHRFFRPDAP